MSGASDGVAGMAGGAGWTCLHMISSPGLFLKWLDPKKMKMGASKTLKVYAQKSHIITSFAFYWSN